MKALYLLFALIGFVLPYAFLVSFLSVNGLNVQLLVGQLFANDISTFFALDLLISAVVFWVFLYREARRRHIRYWWLFVLATLAVGVSFALPLFLFVRESRLKPGQGLA